MMLLIGCTPSIVYVANLKPLSTSLINECIQSCPESLDFCLQGRMLLMTILKEICW